MKKSHLALLVGLVAVFVWSGINPYDRLTWWLEVFPGIFGLIVLAATYRRFQFTTLVYTLITLHISIFCVGGRWPSAHSPVLNLARADCSLGFQSKLQDRQLRRLPPSRACSYSCSRLLESDDEIVHEYGPMDHHVRFLTQHPIRKHMLLALGLFLVPDLPVVSVGE